MTAIHEITDFLIFNGTFIFLLRFAMIYSLVSTIFVYINDVKIEFLELLFLG